MEEVIFTNMCMIKDESKNMVLVQNRKKSWTGIAFPGGHVEVGESIVDSVVREIKEETGLNIADLKICGVKQWFREGVRNVCFLFQTSTFTGDLSSNDEGDNYWVELKDITNLNLATGFDKMLQIFINESLNEQYIIKNQDNVSVHFLK